MKNVGDGKALQITVDASGNPKIEEKRERDYLTFTCLEDGSISYDNTYYSPNFEISLNGANWTTWNYSAITLSVGDVLKMKGNNPNGVVPDKDSGKFLMAGKIAASGNIMSLIDGQKDGTKVIPTDYCFCNLFEGCSSLISAPELPAITLTKRCYGELFDGCSITTAPELPATTMTNSCYYGMFKRCSNLITAPELHGVNTDIRCYAAMFKDCSNLTAAPELPVTTLVEDCYSNMFSGCSSLTTAPELPATTLADYCYAAMFGGCSNLNYIKCLATDLSAEGCTEDWVVEVSNSGTFTKASSATWPEGTNGIPSGWTVETA